MPIADSNDVLATKHAHSQAVEYGKLLQRAKDNIGGNYADVIQIPAYTYSLLNAKAAFDALAVSGPRLTFIMETALGLYEDWSAQSADFNAVFTKAPTLRTLVENNIDEFPLTFTATGRQQFATASASIQTSLATQLDNILMHY